MAVLALLENTENRDFRRERVFRHRNDFFVHDDPWLVNRHHLSRNVLLDLCTD